MGNWLFLLPPDGAARQNALYLLNAFQAKTASRHQVHVFDCKKYLAGFDNLLKTPGGDMSVDLLNQSLIVQSLQYKTKRCFIPALCPVTLFTLNLLREQQITTIHWFIEDYKRAAYLRDVLPGYSWLLAVQKGPLPELCRSMNCQFHYLPTAASDYCISLADTHRGEKRRADIAFIGFPSPYRTALLEYLLSNKLSLVIAGEGWHSYRGPLRESIVSGAWVDAPRAAQILGSAAAGLNISFDDPFAHPADAQISPRVFDILALSQALVTEDVPLLHETLGDCHYYTFNSREKAVAQAKKIVAETADERVQKKYRENRDVLLQKHTWEKRADDIIALFP